MSDDESSGSEHEEVKPKYQPKAKSKPSSMPKTDGLDEASVELLQSNRKDRDKMEEEIQELRARAEKRKKQRDVEEKRLAAERAAEEERRKATEEEKKRKREEDEQRSMKERAKKQAEFEKMRSQTGPNFVIKKKEGDEENEHEVKDKKSKEQLEAEKRAILSQRVQPLEISGFDSSKLKEKAKDLLKVIYKLEGETYDLEKRFKTQQVDMMELAEKARQANKVGKGGLKRVQPGEEVDMMQTKFAGTPAKIEMYSKYERQTDKREYSERKGRFAGPQFIHPVDRIKPTKSIKWDEDNIPLYCPPEGGHEQPAE